MTRMTGPDCAVMCNLISTRTRTQAPRQNNHANFVTISTKYRVLPLPADFKTKKCRLWMAHKLRPSPEIYYTQLSLYDARI